MQNTDKRAEIEARLEAVYCQTQKESQGLCDRVSLEAFRTLVRKDGEKEIWTEALQAALNVHEIVVIPAREEPYYIDSTVVLPSDRRIEAEGATVRLTKECDVVMFLSHRAADGTHSPLEGEKTPCAHNISIFGGRFEEAHTERAGYGKSGKSDKDRRMYGVSCLWYLGNTKGLIVQDVTFAHTGGFAVQLGDTENAFFDNIRFEHCYADGIHINGNTQNVRCRHIHGQVGDDLVALNAYDWQDSSINFGSIDTVLCEDLDAWEGSLYRALRAVPGVYWYDDGVRKECRVQNVIFRKVKGVRTFKMYYQTPVYTIGTQPERGAVGKADHIYLEDMDFDLCEPVDGLAEYTQSDPVRGAFGAVELGADIGYMRLENIRLRLYKEKYPYSYLVCCGPKSARMGEREIFDPYLSNTVQTLVLSNITVNGERVTSERKLVHETRFEDVNRDGHSTGCGRIAGLVIE